MSYKAYLFDFDGTLVESMPIFVSVMLRIPDYNYNTNKSAKMSGIKVCGVYDSSSK